MIHSNYIFNKASVLNSKSLEQGTHIIIFDALQIPPHLFLAVNGTIFTLNIQGLKFYDHVDSFLRLAKRRSKAIISICLKEGLTNVMSTKEVFNIFNDLERVGNDITCLKPIEMYLSKRFNVNFPDNSVIFDVIDQLKDNALIEKIQYFNFPFSVNEEREVRMKYYDIEAVQSHILHI